jgi:hypothetical protein
MAFWFDEKTQTRYEKMLPKVQDELMKKTGWNEKELINYLEIMYELKLID